MKLSLWFVSREIHRISTCYYIGILTYIINYRCQRKSSILFHLADIVISRYIKTHSKFRISVLLRKQCLNAKNVPNFCFIISKQESEKSGWLELKWLISKNSKLHWKCKNCVFAAVSTQRVLRVNNYPSNYCSPIIKHA